MNFKWFSKLSLQNKLIVNSLIVSLMSLLVLTIALVAHDKRDAASNLQERLTKTAKTLAGHVSYGIRFEDKQSLQKLLDTLLFNEWIEEAYIFDTSTDKGRVVGEYKKRPDQEPPQSASKERSQKITTTDIEVWEPVSYHGKPIGSLFIKNSLKELETIKQQKISILTATIVATIIFVWFLSKVMQDSLTRPIQELAAAARQVARTQDFSARARRFSDDEVGELVSQFNNMLEIVQQADKDRQAAAKKILRLNQDLDKKVQERVKELTSTNGELTVALDTLKETQSQLVENEKMASLGSLVAGVAHEINTPIGISVTAASHLIQELDELQELYDSKKMKKKDFVKVLETGKESCEIVLNNLQRAAALIRSFKKVAVDRSDETPQEYSPKTYLGDILTSLQPKFRNTEHEVETECNETLAYGYPGAFGQIITNLVDNSILHGFDDGRNGKITIKVTEVGEDLLLEYLDNGRGLPADQLKLLFEPFFTTKRGSGGAGLGAHIIYNLCTQTLGGSIKAESNEGEGLKLTIQFPKRLKIQSEAPRAEENNDDSEEVSA